MRIDSHQHFWTYNAQRDAWITDDMHVIRRNFYPDDLAPHLMEHKLNGSVAVQAAQSEEETDFLLRLADANDFIRGVVGWVDLRAADLAGRLQHYRSFAKLKGFRHILQAEPHGFMTNEKFIRGVRTLATFGFTYDLLVYHYQLSEAIKFLSETQDVKIVIDHLAKPSIRTRDIAGWKSHMREAAACPNVYCKVSGMVTEADWAHWKEGDFRPYLDHVFDSFGPRRIMYGSDWPVCLVAATYDEQLRIVSDYIDFLSDEEKENVMGKNAERFYNL